MSPELELMMSAAGRVKVGCVWNRKVETKELLIHWEV